MAPSPLAPLLVITGLVVSAGALASVVAWVASADALQDDLSVLAEDVTGSTGRSWVAVRDAAGHVEGDRVTDLQLLVRHQGRQPVPLDALEVRVDGLPGAVVRVLAVTDDDGSLEEGTFGPGDQLRLTIVLSDPLPAKAMVVVSLEAGHSGTASALLVVPRHLSTSLVTLEVRSA